jgi:hypothetical protein
MKEVDMNYGDTGTLTVTTGGNLQQVGNVVPLTGNCIDYGQYGQYWPWHTNWYIHTTPEPVDCIGKAHVFECEHVKACKCGKVERVMKQAKKAKRAK